MTKFLLSSVTVYWYLVLIYLHTSYCLININKLRTSTRSRVDSKLDIRKFVLATELLINGTIGTHLLG